MGWFCLRNHPQKLPELGMAEGEFEVRVSSEVEQGTNVDIQIPVRL